MVSFIFTKEPSLSYLGYTKCKTLKVEKSFADRLREKMKVNFIS